MSFWFDDGSFAIARPATGEKLVLVMFFAGVQWFERLLRMAEMLTGRT